MIFIISFLVVLWFELLALQVLYRLSHASSSFCSGYFGDGVLLLALAGLTAILFYASCQEAWHAPLHPTFFSITWNGYPPNLRLPSS
jgi:hypothetical protein